MLSHILAAVFLEIAYLATGIFLCFMGMRLLEKGIESKTRFEGEAVGQKWVLFTTSPGVVFVVCGVGIIIYAIVTQSEYKAYLVERIKQDGQMQVAESGNGSILVQSRLLNEEASAANSLNSRVAIYALRHKQRHQGQQDISALIAEMPTAADLEPWPKTYDRFARMLRENPTTLGEILFRPEYRWLHQRNQNDATLSALVNIETERLLNVETQ